MKIMLVHNRPRSNGPSGESRVVDRESAALAEAGHEVIRVGADSDEIEQWPAARKALLPARIIWSQQTYRSLQAALRGNRPDVVHVHNTFPLLSAAVLYACRNAGVPLVATLHNYRLGCTPGELFRDGAICHDCLGGRLLPGVVHGCYRGSRVASLPVAASIGVHRPAWRSMVSAYMFISAAQRDLLGGLGLPADRMFVRHNMIPRKEYQGVPKQDTVVFAGRLAVNKGLPVLMAAWDRYLASAADGTRLRLVIAGTGPLDQEVAGWAAGKPSVEVAGLLSSAECAELMAGARAVIVPSTWEEPFGLVVVEAMAAGTPVIASSHGSFVELVTPGVDGVLYPPSDAGALADAIADVAAAPQKYEVLGKQARETYELKFNPESSLRHLLEIYDFAIANPAGSHGARPG
jgi:glycosyltransferase involved in cell wall biosynthesis